MSFFLPSPVELGFSIRTKLANAQPLKYRKVRGIDVDGSMQKCWLRGEYVSDRFCYTWVIYDGCLFIRNIGTLNACLFACVVT